jgi:hypothetical protein
MINPMVHASILLFLAVLFGLAVVHKLGDFRGFISILSSYLKATPFRNQTFILLLAFIAISWEILIVMTALSAFLLPSAASLAGLLSATLLTAYAAAMAFNILRGNVLLDCGCSWGEGKTPVNFLLVSRGLMLAGLSCLLLLPAPSSLFSGFEVLNIIAISLFAYILYLIVDQIILNQTRKQELP